MQFQSTLFNVDINELLLPTDRDVKSLFYANDFVLLSPTEKGLQQQLDKVEKSCSNIGPGSKYEDS